MSQYIFSCNVEDITTIAEFVKTSYVRDQARFFAYSPDFDPAYLALFEDEILVAEGVVAPKTFTHNLKQITQRLYTSMDTLGDQLKLLQGYVTRTSTSLSVQVSDFGIPALQRALNKRNAAGALSLLKVTLKHVDDNLPALQAKGFTTNARTLLSDLQASIKKENQAQNTKLNERGEQIQSNAQVLNTLWIRMKDVMSTGKILFDKDPVKKQEYTMSALQRRVTPERKNTVTSPAHVTG
jgi:hypothetical protein